jgi:hypothetical protein
MRIEDDVVAGWRARTLTQAAGCATAGCATAEAIARLRVPANRGERRGRRGGCTGSTSGSGGSAGCSGSSGGLGKDYWNT